MPQNKIALVGSTGQIGKSILNNLSKSNHIVEFSRSLNNNIAKSDIRFDAVINAAGISFVDKNTSDIIDVTNSIDNDIMFYINRHPSCKFINISSGAATIDNDDNFYVIAKRDNENRHRKSNKSIVDIRVYSFFTRYANLNYRFFMHDVAKCIINKDKFTTNDTNILRDYVDPIDLCNMIECIMKYQDINTGVDIFSSHPVSKFEILEAMRALFNLEYSVSKKPVYKSRTTDKVSYYPEKNTIIKGYSPIYSSIETIISEMAFLCRK